LHPSLSPLVQRFSVVVSASSSPDGNGDDTQFKHSFIRSSYRATNDFPFIIIIAKISILSKGKVNTTPNHEEHCQHSLKRYGIRGDDIHAWMDEPSRIAGATHRKFRHGLPNLPTAIQLFGKIYGPEIVENIFLDHLKADSEENRKNEQESRESLSSENLSSESPKPKMWSDAEIALLTQCFAKLPDHKLDGCISNRSATEIRKKIEQLKLIKPIIMKRSFLQSTVQRLVFELKKGQRFYWSIKVAGGNNNVDFGFFRHQGLSVSHSFPKHKQKIEGYEEFKFDVNIGGNYCFYFANFASNFSYTKKRIDFSYHLEFGAHTPINFQI
jgi:hypothetical protein